MSPAFNRFKDSGSKKSIKRDECIPINMRAMQNVLTPGNVRLPATISFNVRSCSNIQNRIEV